MKDRKMESQQQLRAIANMAFGVYIKEEINKGDSWRDIEWGKLWTHFKHEVEEIKNSKTRSRQFHNILDAINLLEMLGAKIQFKNEKEKRKE